MLLVVEGVNVLADDVNGLKEKLKESKAKFVKLEKKSKTVLGYFLKFGHLLQSHKLLNKQHIKVLEKFSSQENQNDQSDDEDIENDDEDWEAAANAIESQLGSDTLFASTQTDSVIEETSALSTISQNVERVSTCTQTEPFSEFTTSILNDVLSTYIDIPPCLSPLQSSPKSHKKKPTVSKEHKSTQCSLSTTVPQEKQPISLEMCGCATKLDAIQAKLEALETLKNCDINNMVEQQTVKHHSDSDDVVVIVLNVENKVVTAMTDNSLTDLDHSYCANELEAAKEETSVELQNSLIRIETECSVSEVSNATVLPDSALCDRIQEESTTVSSRVNVPFFRIGAITNISDTEKMKPLNKPFRNVNFLKKSHLCHNEPCDNSLLNNASDLESNRSLVLQNSGKNGAANRETIPNRIQQNKLLYGVKQRIHEVKTKSTASLLDKKENVNNGVHFADRETLNLFSSSDDSCNSAEEISESRANCNANVNNIVNSTDREILNLFSSDDSCSSAEDVSESFVNRNSEKTDVVDNVLSEVIVANKFKTVISPLRASPLKDRNNKVLSNENLETRSYRRPIKRPGEPLTCKKLTQNVIRRNILTDGALKSTTPPLSRILPRQKRPENHNVVIECVEEFTSPAPKKVRISHLFNKDVTVSDKQTANADQCLGTGSSNTALTSCALPTLVPNKPENENSVDSPVKNVEDVSIEAKTLAEPLQTSLPLPVLSLPASSVNLAEKETADSNDQWQSNWQSILNSNLFRKHKHQIELSDSRSEVDVAEGVSQILSSIDSSDNSQAWKTVANRIISSFTRPEVDVFLLIQELAKWIKSTAVDITNVAAAALASNPDEPNIEAVLTANERKCLGLIDNLEPKFIKEIESALLVNFMELIFNLDNVCERAALFRVLIAYYKRHSSIHVARIACYDVLYHGPASSGSLLAFAFSVWPKIFTDDCARSKPIMKVIWYIMKNESSAIKFPEQFAHVIKPLFLSDDALDDSTSLADYLLDVLKTDNKLTFEASKSLELLAKVKQWEWTKTILIEERLIPVFTQNSLKTCIFNYNQAIFVKANYMYLLGCLGKHAPFNDLDINVIRNILSVANSLLKRQKVGLCLQETAALVAMMLMNYDNSLACFVISKWLPNHRKIISKPLIEFLTNSKLDIAIQ
ncbi:hypothetical protein CHUAL_003407 [Chamberlinius hualienensis]